MVLDRLLLSVILMLSFASAAVAQREEPAPPPAAVVENDSRKAGEGGEGEKLKKLPGLTINREEGFVDLDAKVVLREGDWLELLACSPNSREHESIVTVSARPSHIHLSLLLLGAEAGKPMTWKRLDDQIITDPPRGPKIMAYFVLTENGKTKEIP
ncbi:MAG: YdjY domain-containing protein, partial [Rhodospirillales bacterium]|nr:YdjY domain-containing protein [Rhodospirillales bacterium]